jgi:hypothetical protein
MLTGNYTARCWSGTVGNVRPADRGRISKFTTSNFAADKVRIRNRTSLLYALHATMIFIVLEWSDGPGDLVVGRETRSNMNKEESAGSKSVLDKMKEIARGYGVDVTDGADRGILAIGILGGISEKYNEETWSASGSRATIVRSWPEIARH